MSESESPRRHSLPESIAGRYTLVSELGAGGMGVVYKALDVRLNRSVAIKAVHDRRLTPATASRLREEALAVASLDHPYICKIYELIEDGDETLIVMEYIEGETLASMLRDGPLALPLTLQIGREIAEGLADAHSRGLVHRDIKPSNVMVTSHGHVKLLDFGLARADIASTPAADTHTSPARQTSYAGTPFYMAPEQAAGEPVTARADLFSLGVLLFESLTGVLPFEGTTPFDYVRHVLTDRPRSLGRLAAHVPSDLVRLIDRCLEKTPAQRPESASVIVDELRRLRDAMSNEGGVSLRTAGDEHARARRLMTGAIAVLVVVAVVGWIWWRSRPAPILTSRSLPVVTWPTEESDSRISPDARWLSFVSVRGGAAQLYVQPLDGTDAKAVTIAAGTPMSHAWAPDGRTIAAVIQQPDRVVLQVVPAFFGGAAQQTIAIAPTPSRVRGLRWIGRAVYLTSIDRTGRHLLRADLDTGQVADVSGSWVLPGRPGFFDVHPDGLRAAVSVSENTGDNLWLINLDGTGATRLNDDPSFERSPLWRGAGATLIFQSNRGGQIDLWEMDPRTRRMWPLTSSATEETPESSSPDGSLVSFEQQSEEAHLWRWTAAGAAHQLTADALSDVAPALSADGRSIAFQRARPSPAQGAMLFDATLFVAPLDGSGGISELRRIADGHSASLAPDGSAIAFHARSADPAKTTIHVTQIGTDASVTISSNGSLPAFSLRPLDWAARSLAWHPSGRALFFVEQANVTTLGQYQVGAASAGAPLATGRGPREIMRDLQVSPDGASLAFLHSGPQRTLVRIVDLATGAVRDIASIDAGFTGVFNRGWLPGQSALLLVRLGDVHDDTSAEMSLLHVPVNGGAPRTVAVIGRAFITTSRLDAAGRTLYVTRSEAGIHNVFAIDVQTGAARRVTSNTLPSVTFSGFEPIGPDGVIGALDERKRDIWLMDARHSANK